MEAAEILWGLLSNDSINHFVLDDGFVYTEKKDRTDLEVLNKFQDSWDIERLYNALLGHIINYYNGCGCRVKANKLLINFLGGGNNENAYDEIVLDRIISLMLAYNKEEEIEIFRMYNQPASLALSLTIEYPEKSINHDETDEEIKYLLSKCEIFVNRDSRIFSEQELIMNYGYPTFTDEELELEMSIWKMYYEGKITFIPNPKTGLWG